VSHISFEASRLLRAVGCLLYELCALRPPFDAPNQLSLAMKINSGKFHRIPNKYSEDLHGVIRSGFSQEQYSSSIHTSTTHRSMLQVDPNRRPSIDELENLPALQVPH
jgi:serine/threonine protein kinase